MWHKESAPTGHKSKSLERKENRSLDGCYIQRALQCSSHSSQLCSATSLQPTLQFLTWKEELMNGFCFLHSNSVCLLQHLLHLQRCSSYKYNFPPFFHCCPLVPSETYGMTCCGDAWDSNCSSDIMLFFFFSKGDTRSNTCKNIHTEYTIFML